MAIKRKIGERVILVASIEQSQYEALRFIAYTEKRSIAHITREALDNYIALKSKEYPITVSVAKAETQN